MASAYMFSHYWPGDGVAGEPPPATAQGYTNAAVIGCFYPGRLPMPTIPRRWTKRWQRLWITFYRRYVPERLYILVRVLRFLYSSDYTRAQQAVRAVAVSGLSNKKLWGHIGNRAGKDPVLAENLFRHLAALEHYGASSNYSERNLLLELAWMARKDRHQ